VPLAESHGNSRTSRGAGPVRPARPRIANGERSALSRSIKPVLEALWRNTGKQLVERSRDEVWAKFPER
jgi:hypothetical protein